MVYKKLTDRDRRQMILDALSPEANISHLARYYGVHRNSIHAHLVAARKDAEGKYEEALEEAAFRRKVYEATRKGWTESQPPSWAGALGRN